MRRGTFTAGSFLLVCLLAVILQPGCAGLRSTSTALSKPGAKLYVVTTDLTAFYRYSPRQGGGPDKRLPRDTQMKLIRPSSSFCKVQLVDGEQGFVASDDIGPAAATLLASNNAPSEKPPANSSEWRAETPEPRSSTPEPPLPDFEPTPIALPPGSGN
jgi:hypothetical protein